jgi:hypothetical protein
MAGSKRDDKKITPRPLPPPPPGERPPVYTKAEMDAHFEFQKLQWAQFEALFTLNELESIAIEARAPSIKEAPQAQQIVQSICSLISSNKSLRENPALTSRMKDLTTTKKNWLAVRRYICEVREAQTEQLAYFEKRPYYAGCVEDRKNNLSKINNALTAMDELTFVLFISDDHKKQKGERGPGALKSVILAADIFMRLDHAWGEIGVTNVSKAKRYDIVQKLMAKANENVSVEAIKTAIENRLKAYPRWEP